MEFFRLAGWTTRKPPRGGAASFVAFKGFTCRGRCVLDLNFGPVLRAYSKIFLNCGESDLPYSIRCSR
jgi:hypothetical protein